jgi:hypothetical protein
MDSITTTLLQDAPGFGFPAAEAARVSQHGTGKRVPLTNWT